MIKHFVLLILLSVFQISLSAQDNTQDTTQQQVIVQIRTFKAKVKVVGILQGRYDLAVIKVLEVDDNKWKLSIGDEILCKFYFTTKPYKGDTYYPGVKGGEVLEADIHALANKNTVQVDYNILRYKVLEANKTEEEKK